MSSPADQLDARIRASLLECMPLPEGTEANLRDALQHSLATAGRLARPKLAMQVALAYDLPPSVAEDFAVALEYFHTASLLFDDLPVMDDARERRGVPCLHLLFTEADAMMAALALINRAYSMMWSATANMARPQQKLALKYLEARLGTAGLVNGQSLDLHYKDLPHNLATVQRIALGKTVSLIRMAIVLPAIVADAPAADVQLLERIAMFWGLSYQIVDDLKDVQPGTVDTGKTPHRDSTLQRPNVVLLLGTEVAVARLERLTSMGATAYDRLVIRRPQTAFLQQLHGNLVEECERARRHLHAGEEVRA